jgi:hypothetical protein
MHFLTEVGMSLERPIILYDIGYALCKVEAVMLLKYS